MMRMVALRLLLTLPILLGVSIVAFVLMRALPGDFAQASAGTTTISPEALDQLRRNLGLDRPVWEQYLAWLARALSGDLGTSFATKRPVLGELVPRFMVTAELTLVVLLFGLYFPTIGIFNYVPFATDPLGNLASMVLPGISLALTVSVTISENTRAAILEVASQDYVMVARAKGLSRGTILRDYLGRNALTPVITVAGLQLAALLGGSILIETIFTIPGMGQYLFDSVTTRDYPAIQGIVLVAATVVLLVNVAVDIAYARVDARVSYD